VNREGKADAVANALDKPIDHVSTEIEADTSTR
jgi:hypothetical protein